MNLNLLSSCEKQMHIYSMFDYFLRRFQSLVSQNLSIIIKNNSAVVLLQYLQAGAVDIVVGILAF